MERSYFPLIISAATKLQYFFKKAGPSGASMLEAERAGLQAMHEADAIRVPRPICGGTGPGGDLPPGIDGFTHCAFLLV